MKWEDVRLLASVIRYGSISAAARHERASIATVARRIALLEAQLGVGLLHRGRDGARATHHGAVLARAAAKAEDAMGEIERIAFALKAGNEAPVRVSATEPVISDFLAPALGQFWARAPNIRLSLSSTTDVVSLAAGDAEIVVRLAKPEGDSLTVRRVATLSLGLYASAAYLHGRQPSEICLQQERLLGYDDSFGPIQEVAWFEANGLAQHLALQTSSTAGLLAAARAGTGIAILPCYVTTRGEKLIAIPTPRPIPPRLIYLMSHRSLARDPRILAVRSWITQIFANVR